MTWDDFYKGRLLDAGYQSYVEARYAPFLAEIVTRMKTGDRIVEVGCGLGTITRILADSCAREKFFVGFRAYDIDPQMVEYARQTLYTGLNEYDGYPVTVGDARLVTGCRPDVVHSHGMLEHMSDDDIRRVIDAHHRDEARHAVHYVPGDKYAKPSFGDERLMPLDWWRQFGPTKAFTFNDGFDYCLVWDFYK